MTLIGLFGINCSGKDTVIRKMQELDKTVLFVRSSKVFMLAMGYDVDPLSPEVPKKECYVALENLSQSEADFITDNYFPKYLRALKNINPKIIATFHVVLLKRDRLKKLNLYIEKQRDWYKTVLDGAAYLTANLDSIWRRRHNYDERDRGQFTIDEVGLQLSAANREWDRLVITQFKGRIPYCEIYNSDSFVATDNEKKVVESAQLVINFMNQIRNGSSGGDNV